MLVTLTILVALSWALAVWSLYYTLTIEHHGRVENCRATNELLVQLHIAFTDIGYPAIGDRFIVSNRCEEIP